MKKLFVFDLDGTLLNDDAIILNSSILGLKLAVEKGHEIAIITGRNFIQLEKYLPLLPKIRYISTINGGILTDLDKQENTVLSTPIDKEIVYDFIDHAKRIKREFQCSNVDQFFRVYFGTTPEQDILDQSFFKTGTKKPKYDNWEDVSGIIKKMDILHMAIKCEPAIRLNEIKKIKDKWDKSKQCTITETSNCYIDCDSLNINKCRILKKIQKLLSISNENTFFFGDSNNDALAIQYCGNGVAMGNARTAVKNIAKYVIGNNNSDAIYDFLSNVLSYE